MTITRNAVIHYVYRLDADSGEYYIGVRSSRVDFARDRYMGSGAWCRKCRKAKIRVRKTLLSEHLTRNEASAAELSVICERWGDERLMNRARSSSRPLFGPRGIHRNNRIAFVLSAIWKLPCHVRVLWVTMMAYAEDDTGLVWVHPGILRKFANLTQVEFDDAIDVLLRRGSIFKEGTVYAFTHGTEPEFNDV